MSKLWKYVITNIPIYYIIYNVFHNSAVNNFNHFDRSLLTIILNFTIVFIKKILLINVLK